MCSKNKTVAVVGMLCEAFGRKPTQATYGAYHVALEDLTDEQVQAGGIAALRQNRQFMPTSGELRELSLTGGVSIESVAEAAWREYDSAVGHHGADHSVSFEDGLINATIRTLGGWPWCCSRERDDYHVWLRRSFIETYTRFIREGGASEELRAPLYGRLAGQNVGQSRGQLSGNVYLGEVVTVKTTRKVLQGPTDGRRMITGSGPAGTKTIGQVMNQLAQELSDDLESDEVDSEGNHEE